MNKYIISAIIGGFAFGSAFHNAISSDYEDGVASGFSEAAGVVCATKFEVTTSDFKLCAEKTYDKFMQVHKVYNYPNEDGSLRETLMSYMTFKWDQFIATNAPAEHSSYANRRLERSEKEFVKHWERF